MQSDNEDESAVGQQTWNKVAHAMHREGFREGMAAGRDEAFQGGFDRGFKVGFSCGGKLAYSNGFLRFVGEHEKLRSTLKDKGVWPIPPYTKPSRGACVICPKGKVQLTKKDMAQAEIPVDRPIEDVVEEQEEVVLRLKDKADSTLEEVKWILNNGKYEDNSQCKV